MMNFPVFHASSEAVQNQARPNPILFTLSLTPLMSLIKKTIERRTSNAELGTPSAANLYFTLTKIMSFFDESDNLRTHRKIWIPAVAYPGLEAGLELHAS